MMKGFLIILALLWGELIWAEEKPVATNSSPAPVVKAVPEPKLNPEKGENSKVKADGSLTGNAPTDIGLIRTEKTKNCKMVRGKLKCRKKHTY